MEVLGGLRDAGAARWPGQGLIWPTGGPGYVPGYRAADQILGIHTDQGSSPLSQELHNTVQCIQCIQCIQCHYVTAAALIATLWRWNDTRQRPQYWLSGHTRHLGGHDGIETLAVKGIRLELSVDASGLLILVSRCRP